MLFLSTKVVSCFSVQLVIGGECVSGEMASNFFIFLLRRSKGKMLPVKLWAQLNKWTWSHTIWLACAVATANRDGDSLCERSSPEVFLFSSRFWWNDESKKVNYPNQDLSFLQFAFYHIRLQAWNTRGNETSREGHLHIRCGTAKNVCNYDEGVLVFTDQRGLISA